MLGCLLLNWGCTKKVGSVERVDEVRAMFPDLVPLARPDYAAIFGKLPNEAELELGRMLFNDPILARNNDVSCATCHLSNHGFADGNPLSFGPLGRGGPHGDNVGRHFGAGVLSLDRGPSHDRFGFIASQFMFRNTLSTVNVVYRTDSTNEKGLFWDGRFGILNFQTLLPIHTAIEMCGVNPLPPAGEGAEIFSEKGPLFSSPVLLDHSHTYDPVTGVDTGSFNSRPELIRGIPAMRPNGKRTIPARNECLAIAVAKLRTVPAYVKLFREAYGTELIEDRHLGDALAIFLQTHVALETPYDSFARGENSLSDQQLLGLAVFMQPSGATFSLGGKVYMGAGCAGCHSPPLFGGSGFASLGVVSDARSELSVPERIADLNHGFFARNSLQRGRVPNCHIEGVTVTAKYVPDIGRANATFSQDDCFKFRIPALRNVIETFPYFHHGTARGQGSFGVTLQERALAGLRQVIDYHLTGPVDPTFVARLSGTQVYFDDTYQRDHLVPLYAQQFSKSPGVDNLNFPLGVSPEAREALVAFIAAGLFDPNATKVGGLGNDVSHPKHVPSGFTPSITRDAGHQLELPPNRHKDTKPQAAGTLSAK